MDDDQLWDGFARAVIRIELPAGPHRIEPRRPGDVGRFPFAGPVHIVTAHNPAGRPVSEVDNEAFHARLRADLAGRPSAATVGSAVDGSMAEPGFAILDMGLPEAVALGARFGQAAIYRWTADELAIVGVDDTRTTEMGWALVAL